MCEHVPGKDFHFSDHDGVEAVLELCQEENRTPSPPGGMADGEGGRERERERECVCVCVWEKEREIKRLR